MPDTATLPPDAESQPETTEPARWVEEYGDLLFRFALARVRQREVAEDLVQEALLAAWQSRHRFQGKSSQKTWLFQILRHKSSIICARQAAKWEWPTAMTWRLSQKVNSPAVLPVPPIGSAA